MQEILTISLMAWYLSVGLGFVQTLKWWLKIKRIRFEDKNGMIIEKRLKPFDCPKCMGFWIGIVYFFSTGHPTQYVLIYAILSSCFAIIIEKGIVRL